MNTPINGVLLSKQCHQKQDHTSQDEVLRNIDIVILVGWLKRHFLVSQSNKRYFNLF